MLIACSPFRLARLVLLFTVAVVEPAFAAAAVASLCCAVLFKYHGLYFMNSHLHLFSFQYILNSSSFSCSFDRN